MATTYIEAINSVYEQLRENPSSKESNKVYPLNLVKSSLSDIQQRELSKKNYPFLNKTENFNASIDTTLSVATTVGAITITLTDSSGLKSSGKIVINEEVITYTGNTANVLTGVTGVGVIHAVGTKVKQVYQIEADLAITDYEKSISLFVDDKELIYYDYRGKQSETGYTVYDGNIYLPIQSKVTVGVFKYKKEVADLVDDSDEFTVPDKYQEFCEEYTLYKCYKQIGDTNATEAYNEYRRIVMEMEADYAMQVDNKFKTINSVYQSKH